MPRGMQRFHLPFPSLQLTPLFGCLSSCLSLEEWNPYMTSKTGAAIRSSGLILYPHIQPLNTCIILIPFRMDYMLQGCSIVRASFHSIRGEAMNIYFTPLRNGGTWGMRGPRKPASADRKRIRNDRSVRIPNRHGQRVG